MKGDGDCPFAIPSVFYLFHKNNLHAFFSTGCNRHIDMCKMNIQKRELHSENAVSNPHLYWE